MTKTEALKMLDEHKNKLIDPHDMLYWTWLRVIILQIPDKDWETYVGAATEMLSQ